MIEKLKLRIKKLRLTIVLGFMANHVIILINQYASTETINNQNQSGKTPTSSTPLIVKERSFFTQAEKYSFDEYKRN